MLLVSGDGNRSTEKLLKQKKEKTIQSFLIESTLMGAGENDHRQSQQPTHNSNSTQSELIFQNNSEQLKTNNSTVHQNEMMQQNSNSTRLLTAPIANKQSHLWPAHECL